MKFCLLRTRALIFCCLMLLGFGSAFAFDTSVIAVRGDVPNAEYFYTNDHYATFQRIQE